MSLIKQHLGEGLEVTLGGPEEDKQFKIRLLPIGIESMDYYLDVAEHMGNVNDEELGKALESGDMSAVSKAFTKDARKSINAMIMETLRVSLPNEEERDLSVLAAQNYDVLMQGAMQVNAPQQSSHEDLKKKFIEERLQAQKARKENESSTKD